MDFPRQRAARAIRTFPVIRVCLGIWMALNAVGENAEISDAASHWAFRTVAKVDPPEVIDSSWVRNPIDRFVLAGLESQGLRPAAPATREQFIRRVSLDLIGLPPTLAEIDAFLADSSTDAHERLIDRLLASPHYGERWGRHWLDLARYAETDGFEHDALRPQAWRYRDYVIRSFNEDLPFDTFIREQIAGDELWPDQPQSIVATAFNLLGPDMVDSADPIQRRLNTLNDATDTTASVFLGLTLGCARCHDHKSEPLTQRDYFSFQAFFTPADFLRDAPIPTPAERLSHDSAMAEYRARTEVWRRQLDALEGPYREKLRSARLSKLSEDAQLAHKTPKDQRTVEQQGTVEETAPALRFTDAELTESMSEGDRNRRSELLAELKGVPKPPPMPTTMALRNKAGPPPKTFILGRGDYTNPGEAVEPGFPGVLEDTTRSEPRIDSVPGTNPPGDNANSRAALAHWIASPGNPLTARVMVNRIWQHHFGRGLVATPSDFGIRGSRPTHPELLDWLATEFVAQGWSLKAMHQLILNSATYRQSSVPSSDARTRDPENRLLSHQNRIRLEGEVVRDSLLAISGRLNPRAGGPSVSPPIPSEITRTSKNWTSSPDIADHTRRSVYILARRNLRFPFLEVFDAPDNNLSCAQRGRSTTAPQALTLLNSEEVTAAASRMASQLLEAADSDQDRVVHAFRLALGRRPTTDELRMSLEFLDATNHRFMSSESSDGTAGTGPATSESPMRGAWSEFCRALFNLNAFVYVD
ncbi:MAG: DUF1549 and DUF1553 domain-containing protein [Limisphaerales bacterium]